MPTLGGIVLDVAEGYIVLSGGTRVSVSSRIKPDDLVKGVLVTIQARLRGTEWVADDIG
jgi:hypothetical protein